MFGELHSPAGGDDIISHYYWYNTMHSRIGTCTIISIPLLTVTILFLPSPSGKYYNSYPVQEYLYKSVELSHYEIFTSLQYPFFLLSW